jgi:hypothetical protein
MWYGMAGWGTLQNVLVYAASFLASVVGIGLGLMLGKAGFTDR